MNSQCYMCLQPAIGQCLDCQRFYCRDNSALIYKERYYDHIIRKRVVEKIYDSPTCDFGPYCKRCAAKRARTAFEEAMKQRSVYEIERAVRDLGWLQEAEILVKVLEFLHSRWVSTQEYTGEYIPSEYIIGKDGELIVFSEVLTCGHIELEATHALGRVYEPWVVPVTPVLISTFIRNEIEYTKEKHVDNWRTCSVAMAGIACIHDQSALHELENLLRESRTDWGHDLIQGVITAIQAPIETQTVRR